MSLEEVKEVCKELKLVCKQHNGTDWYVYTNTTNHLRWIACFYYFFDQAVIYHSAEPFINDKN